MSVVRLRCLLLSICLLAGLTASSQSIYKTPSGKKYHRGDCRTVKNVSQKITLAEAKELGLGPCMVCKPPVDRLAPSAENKEKGQSTVSVQCKGITKAGSRCKHNTRIGNGFCFQHQPKGF